MKQLVIIITVFLLGITQLSAQTCTINVSTNIVCIGNTVTFSVVVTGGGTITGYLWDFGNSTTNTQAVNIYQYPAAGKYVPTLTVNFVGGGSCSSTGDTIVVHELPHADFAFTTATSQCFKGNAVCIKNLSVPGPDNAPLTNGNLNWDDGTKIFFTPLYGQIYCHTYNDPFGGIYTPVIEVTDANGCISRLEKKDSITIFPKMQPIGFNATYTLSCPQTPAKFTNLSAIPRNQVSKFKWDFGDGSIDSVRWDTLTHIYKLGGSFDAKLFVTDINNCIDSFILIDAAANALLDSTIYILPDDHSCYRKNNFLFSSRNPGADIRWSLYNSTNYMIDTTPSLQSPYSFSDCGDYTLRMYVNYPGSNCKAYTDTLLTVYGPNAVAQEDTIGRRIIGQIQCQIHDTVKFRTPVPDLDCFNHNIAMNRIWDFGDGFAPACTTDTKNGINVNANCRWSKDSMNVWHYYTPGTENCYRVSLLLEDPVRGCWDSDTAVLKLTAPNAHPTPGKRGVYYKGIPCIGGSIPFMFDEVLPQCGYDTAWLMPDSACGNGQWIPVPKGQNKINYTYIQTCDSSGWVTYGAIVKNGDDITGATCYDTAWYHFQILPIVPKFNYKITGTCAPYKLELNMLDSLQDSIINVTWGVEVHSSVPSQGFNSIVFDTSFNQVLNPATDTVIHGHTLMIPSQGVALVGVNITNALGCEMSDLIYIPLGYQKDISASKRKLCLGDTVTLYDIGQYFSSEFPYWEDTARANANLERVWWDIGDSNGFSIAGHNPVIKYTKPGVYTIRMAIQDSLGCRDTIQNTAYISVYDINAQMRVFPSAHACAPFFVNLFDSTIISGNESIVSWEWTFSDNKPRSLLPDPQHEFTSNGLFTVNLIVITSIGCTDTTSRSINILGPQPKFDITSDTVGCQPFAAKFKNTTGRQLINWQWSFNDPDNSIFSTNRDTDIVFIYRDPGIYKIRLLGLDSIRDPATGSLKFCTSVFPDTIIDFPSRVIRVLPKAEAFIIGPDSICPNEVDTFIARVDPVYNMFNWNFGDGSSNTLKNFPDTIMSFAYTKSGVYQVMLTPLTIDPLACIDTAYKTVYVRPVTADFDIDESQAPQYHFTNKSSDAVSYNWFIGNELTNKFSEDINPDKQITDTGSVLICLQAFNEQGCWDTACKEVKAKEHIVIPNVFTPGNNDSKNDAFDIDIVGWTKYDLVIFNRWGTPVFKGNKDGLGNDGVNWNGKEYNTGAECSSGVYFYVFKYQLLTGKSETTLHGTITLIRDEN